MSYLDKLPDEILDEIFSYYWTDVFKTTVIKEINNNIDIIKLIDNFITTKLLRLLMMTKDSEIPLFMLYINNYLNKIKLNKGIVLLIKVNFPNHPINYIFNENPYIKLPEWCKYIAIYSISKSGIMRYYIENAIKNLEKPTF